MDARQFRVALRDQRAYCETRSPLYATVLGALEDEAARQPAWLDRLEQSWRGRRFAVAWEAAQLFLACLHFSALRGESPELAEAYPSCGGAGGDAGGAAIAFLNRAPAAFWKRLRVGMVQTNEVGRSVAWMFAACVSFGQQKLPFHLVELGSSAGLNLVGDHLPQACRFVWPDGRPARVPDSWNRPQRVLTRTGLDLCPRDVADPNDRLWLKACIWADDLPRLERFERAAEVFLRLRSATVERCSFADAPDWLLANLPARNAQGLLVFNSIGTSYLDETDYGALQRGMARALAPWRERGVWVEYERARGATHGPLQLKVHRVADDGRLESRVLGSGAPRPDTISLEDSWEVARGAV